MSRFTIYLPTDEAAAAAFSRGLELLFLMEDDPGIGSARVAKARLLDLGDAAGFSEDMVEMLIECAREGSNAVVTPGLFDTLAVLHDLGQIDVVGRAWQQLVDQGVVG